jgi:hypothetical protein
MKPSVGWVQYLISNRRAVTKYKNLLEYAIKVRDFIAGWSKLLLDLLIRGRGSQYAFLSEWQKTSCW